MNSKHSGLQNSLGFVLLFKYLKAWDFVSDSNCSVPQCQVLNKCINFNGFTGRGNKPLDNEKHWMFRYRLFGTN